MNMKLASVLNNRINGNRYRSKVMKDKAFAVSLVVPALIMLILTIIIPVISVVRMSFFEYNLLHMDKAPWNNFDNYISVLKDKEFYLSFLRTITYVFSTVGLAFITGLIFALLLNTEIKGKNLFRGALFLPWTMPQVIIAIVWMWMFQTDYGIMNYVLKSLHLIQENINWVGDPKTAMLSVIIATVWKQMSIMMVIILAGLQTVPAELKEAALMDGANAFQRFWNVILPSIMSVIKTVTLTQIIINFQMFGLFYTMTGGGPVDATSVLSIYTHEAAFMSFNMGKGAAVGVTWLLFLIGFAALYNKVLSRKEIYAD